MSFTDRFLAVPIKTYSVKHKELTGEEELEDGVMKFNPFEMSNYYPTNADENDDRFHLYSHRAEKWRFNSRLFTHG
jgi:UDP-galactopyranose mutase